MRPSNISMRKLYFFFGALLLVDGVFGVDEELSVMEGDSVSLKPRTELKQGDSAQWLFGEIRIADMKKAFVVDDVRFKGRLNLDPKTGSLTITNITTKHDGDYKLHISGKTEKPEQIFSVTVTDVVKSVSVLEGDSVTLHTGVTERDQILWKFGGQDLNGADARWSNTDLKDKTGNLTIRNIRRNQYGDYEVEIKNKNSLILHKKFRITPGMKIMFVKEGDDVTLETDTKTQIDDQILWMYEPGSTRIAEINRAVSNFSLYEDVLDGRFRGRLQLDHQTGSLTITNTRKTDSGVYKLQTSSSEANKYTRFAVFVSDSGLSPGAVAGIVVAVLLAVAGVIYICWKISKLKRPTGCCGK